ncbi:MAG: hypothetical protein KatS3mg012_0613 [Gaiellaceae bacterium]|nr:MAG: hypothetical protein KatS3mg012_0613 [Gaiellaceae bacterium]
MFGSLRESLRQLSTFSRRQWLVAGAGALATALLTGLPTDVFPNPFYTRMTPVLWWNYPVWALTAVLAGLVLATYVRRVPIDSSAGATLGGGLMSLFAVGCPVCNKLVVALIGVGGALSFFAPVQPYLAAAGLALLAVSLAARLRQLERCPAVSYAGPQMAVPKARR